MLIKLEIGEQTFVSMFLRNEHNGKIRIKKSIMAKQDMGDKSHTRLNFLVAFSRCGVAFVGFF
jgi:hypothetical protein